MELETNATTSCVSNETIAEVCEPETAVRKVHAEEILQNKMYKTGKV